MVRRRLLPLALLALALLAPAQASARGGGDDEVRTRGSCGHGASSDLRVRAKDGALRVRFEVDHARSGASWRVAVIQDRRVVWRGRARTHSGSFEIERRLRDLAGADTISVRASGPGGLTCNAGATLRG